MKNYLTFFVFLIFTAVLIAQPYQWVNKRTGSSLGGPIDYNEFNNDIIYYGADNIIYKSVDKGESFSVIGTPVPGASNIKCILLDNFNPGIFLVAVESSPNDKIYKTTNDGTTWTLTNDEGQFYFYGIPMTPDPSHPDHVYTMVGINFKKSTNFGSTWVTIASNFGPAAAPCDIEVFKDTSIILIGDNGTGIFKSTDYGLTWAQKYSTSGEIPTISVDNTNPGVAWAAKWSGGGGFLKSTNYGETWVAQTGFAGVNMWGVHIQPTDGNVIVAGCYSCNNSWRSKNGGQTWTTIPIPSTNYQFSVIDSMNQFAAQGNGFYKLESEYFTPVELSSITVMIEGLYNGTSMVPDTITVQLRNTSAPYSLVDQTKILLDANGQGSGNFFTAVNGTPYYLVVKHQNAVETWSSSPQTFSASTLNYDFTTGSDKAYGNNLKLIGSEWCVYGGDVNRDGFVNTTDVNSVYTGNVSGAQGYISTDLNGDSFSEIYDLNLVFINDILNVERKTPPGFLSENGEDNY